MARAKQSKPIPQLTVAQFDELFPDDDACKAYLVRRRWPEGIRCPRCGSDHVYPLNSRPFHWECPDCRRGGAYRFSVLVETIFEDTKIGLRRWFQVIHLMLTSKKGISSLQVQRYMGFGSYETALHMTHRIRAALIDPEFRKLMGVVEIDETYIGGKRRGKRGRGAAGKSPVVGAVERRGNVVARVINNVGADILTGFVREAVSTKVSLQLTDEWKGYGRVWEEHPSDTIRHSKHEYVVGAIHTNTIEGFWSLIKRGIVCTFHNVSRKYLPLYVAEFEFRYNNRQNADIFGTAVAAC